jgi:hypothetical protein
VCAWHSGERSRAAHRHGAQNYLLKCARTARPDRHTTTATPLPARCQGNLCAAPAVRPSAHFLSRASLSSSHAVFTWTLPVHVIGSARLRRSPDPINNFAVEPSKEHVERESSETTVPDSQCSVDFTLRMRTASSRRSSSDCVQ